jgi:hypothetical protein
MKSANPQKMLAARARAIASTGRAARFVLCSGSVLLGVGGLERFDALGEFVEDDSDDLQRTVQIGCRVLPAVARGCILGELVKGVSVAHLGPPLWSWLGVAVRIAGEVRSSALSGCVGAFLQVSRLVAGYRCGSDTVLCMSADNPHIGPLEQEVADLLQAPATVSDRDWVQGDGRPPDAEMRMSLAALSEEQRGEYLFASVKALGDALRRVAHAIDELQPQRDDSR